MENTSCIVWIVGQVLTRRSLCPGKVRETSGMLSLKFGEITKYVTPDVITTDAGSAFISKQFQDHVETFGTLIRAVPVEAHSSLNRGEQAHGPLRRVFEKLKEERGLSDDTRLALAVKAINEMPNVQGFTPLQLVYGVIPKIPIGIHSPYVRQKERLEALRKARDEYATYIAQRRLKIAQDVRGPGESDLREGDLALVFREESKRWEGPGRVVSLDAGNVAHILLKGGKVTPFSITCVRRFPPLDTPKVSYVSTSNSETHDQEVLHRTETALNQSDARFDDAKKIELQQLLDRGTFTPVLKNKVPLDAVILQTKWILVVKNPGSTDELFKARLVVLGHRDPMKGKIVNEAPTLRSISIRLILSVACSKNWTLFSRDVKGAFLQSNNILRKVFVQLSPRAMRLLDLDPTESVFVLRLPQYGLTDSPTYWWLRFRDYHIFVLKCKDSPIDPCLFISHTDDLKTEGLVGTLVDDTLGAGNMQFLQHEETCSKEFETKQRKEKSFNFGGCDIAQDAESVVIHQRQYTKELEEIPRTSPFSTFQSARGKLQWLMQTRFDLAANVAKISQITEATYDLDGILLLNKTIREARQNPCVLKMSKVCLETAQLIVYCDASFASNRDLTSQLGFLIFLRDDAGHVCLLDGGSKKCDRVTRSVMGAELFALAHGFDRALIIQDFLRNCLQKSFGILLITDSMGIFDAITNLSQFREKRLLIDAHALRNAYTSGELMDIVHVRSEHNLADALTKVDSANAKIQLRNAMNTGTLPELYIHRMIVDAADLKS
jgi:Reverse transcriptase (RNA-dependent DNA polymerase)